LAEIWLIWSCMDTSAARPSTDVETDVDGLREHVRTWMVKARTVRHGAWHHLHVVSSSSDSMFAMLIMEKLYHGIPFLYIFACNSSFAPIPPMPVIRCRVIVWFL